MDENLVLKNIGWSVFGISASYFLLKQIRDKNRKETINEVIYTRSSEINFSSQIFKNIIYERHHPLLRNLEILENIIDSATKSIHLAMFMMTSNDLANVLIKAKDRGVKVFVFLDKDLGGGNAENIAKRLIKKKIEVKVNDQFKMNHLKLCLIDVKSIAGIFQLIDDTIKTTFKKRVKRPLNLPSSGITGEF
jgi:phosphatidylserine/phosphatidylglycerophosphate/cardiolipin synthase-like enzyme